MQDDPDIDEMLRDDAAALQGTPTDESFRRVSEKCLELATLTARVRQLEADLERTKADRNALAQETLPALFDTISTDRFGVPEYNADVVVRPYYHASIPADLPDDEKDAAFDHLEEIGGADLPRCLVFVKLGGKSLGLARRIAAKFEQWQAETNDPELAAAEIRIDRSVPWNTLTSFLQAWYERRDADLEAARTPEEEFAVMTRRPPDLALLRATVGRVCKIEERRAPKTRAKRRAA